MHPKVERWLAGMCNNERKRVIALAYNEAYEKASPRRRESRIHIESSRMQFDSNYHAALERMLAAAKEKGE